MHIEERVVNNVTILDLKGKITLGEGDEALKDKINSLVQQGRMSILLNLGEVPYIDSAGLGQIVRTYTTVSRQGGQLKMVHLTKRITDLLVDHQAPDGFRDVRLGTGSAQELHVSHGHRRDGWAVLRIHFRCLPSHGTPLPRLEISRRISLRRGCSSARCARGSGRRTSWSSPASSSARNSPTRPPPASRSRRSPCSACCPARSTCSTTCAIARPTAVHPIKSRRPIASGALGLGTALAASAVLAGAGLIVAAWINTPFGLVAAAYLALMTWYSVSIKHVVILDVLALAGGFVLRAAGGAVAVQVTFSHWLLLLTLLLALFLALSKRRAELVALTDDARAHRKSLGDYSPYLLDQMIGVVTASTLLAYAFYTINPETVAKFGTDRLLWTVPFPLYGIFRYLYLMHQREGGGNPSDTLLEDRPILACVALWGASVIAILYGPWHG